MELRYVFEESASGHRDSLESAKLHATDDGMGVVLHVLSDHYHQFSQTVPDEKRYQIDAATLERLIIEHGKRIK